MIILYKNCYWDTLTESVKLDGKLVNITLKMRKLLVFMTSNLSQCLNSVDIFFYVWDDFEIEYNSKSVRSLISNLRKRLPGILIHNYYGGLYLLEANKEDHFDIKDDMVEILRQFKDPVAISNPNHRDNPLIFVNDAFTNLFGFHQEDLNGKNYSFLYEQNTNKIYLRDIKKAIDSVTEASVLIQIYTKHGELVHSQLNITPIFDKASKRLKYFLWTSKKVEATQSFAPSSILLFSPSKILKNQAIF